MMKRIWTLGAVASLAVASAWACSSGPSDMSEDGTGGAGGVPAGAGVGDACKSQPCRVGLSCEDGYCALGHSVAAGSPCTLSGECQAGLQCLGGKCLAEGSGAEGDGCRGDVDCQQGLRCTLVGFGAECRPEGTNDVGKSCSTSADCFSGLACAAGACAPTPPGAPSFGVPTWQGVSCDPPNAAGARAYFEVPGAAGAQEGDFFRLPFPNDVRVKDGKLELAGFPTPGTELLGFDPVKRYVDAITRDEHAWGTYPSVIFRFSGPVDYDSFRGKSGSSPVNFIDITAGTPEYGANAGLTWYASSGRSKYVCENWFGVRRPQGAPLTPGHTYAVWLSTAGRDAQGAAIERSENFLAMLSDTAPTDTALAAAWGTFQPFRSYLTDKGIDPTTVLTATVITTSPVREPMRALAEAARAEPTPTAKGWVKCASGVTSPCPQHDGERGCGAGDPAYDEYHALVSLPIFQEGAAPYAASPAGRIATAAVRHEDVCMALTVPKATMPPSGWPLVVYAHGTGGSFRDHVRPEVAGALAGVATPSGGTVRFAVLGIDQVEHGPRRGDSTDSPNQLFFNFANPDAARGNPLQGAVDQLSLARFGAALDLDAAATGGDAIKIDPGALVFFGHSQGATEGSLILPFADEFEAAVLSGNGASIIHALLHKTRPVNIAAALPFVLADYDETGGLPGGEMHPVPSLLAQWIDPADPLNFARAVGAAPEPGHAPKSVFQTYGLGDTYSPPVTLATYALAARLGLVAADPSVTTPDEIGNLTPATAPLSGNLTVDGAEVTLGVREYAPPAGSDGHFVIYDVPSANADAARFLGMAAAGEVPHIGQ